jgi:integration host factor subunit alpha
MLKWLSLCKGVCMSEMSTLTRADLSEAVHAEIGLSRADCSSLIESILGQIGSALEKGENVKISGFGTFILRDKPLRMGRNPKTGVAVPIAPRRVLTFRASPKVRSRIYEAS